MGGGAREAAARGQSAEAGLRRGAEVRSGCAAIAASREACERGSLGLDGVSSRATAGPATWSPPAPPRRGTPSVRAALQLRGTRSAGLDNSSEALGEEGGPPASPDPPQFPKHMARRGWNAALACLIALFAYYTIWVFLTPFVDDDHPTLRLFPSTFYALAVPVAIGSFGLGATLIVLGASLVSASSGALSDTAGRRGPFPPLDLDGARSSETGGLDWAAQLDEAIALAAIFGDDFSIDAVEGVAGSNGIRGDASGSGTGEGEASGSDAREDAPTEAEDIASLDPPTGPWRLSCTLIVPVDVPPEGVCLLLPWEEEGEGGGSAGGDGTGAGEGEAGSEGEGAATPQTAPMGGHVVRHLPPLVLRLAMEAGYPSRSPPRCLLSAPWLSAPHAREVLEGVLGSAALEGGEAAGGVVEPAPGAAREDPTFQPGEPSVYAWAERLREGAVALAAGGRGRGGGARPAARPHLRVPAPPGPDPAAPPEATAAARLASLELLLQHDAAEETRLFLSSSHVCEVCFEEKLGTETTRLACGHSYCRECVGEMARVAIGEGTTGLGQLRCPRSDCRRELGEADLRDALGGPSSAPYLAWQGLALERALAAMPDACRCPRCGTLCLEDEDQCALCESCGYAFCSLCGDAWHARGVRCLSPASRAQALAAKMAGAGERELADLRRREADLRSEAAIRESSKPCPHCGARVQRTDGCNKMVCAMCSGAFCYRCGQAVTGYDHYANGACVLFDEDVIRRWEAALGQAIAREGVGDWGGEGGRDPGRLPPHPDPRRRERNPAVTPCPRCRQPNVRVGRANHLRCWSCGSGFCAACGAVLRRRGDAAWHFRPSGCKQHG